MLGPGDFWSFFFLRRLLYCEIPSRETEHLQSASLSQFSTLLLLLHSSLLYGKQCYSPPADYLNNIKLYACIHLFRVRMSLKSGFCLLTKTYSGYYHNQLWRDIKYLSIVKKKSKGEYKHSHFISFILDDRTKPKVCNILLCFN